MQPLTLNPITVPPDVFVEAALALEGLAYDAVTTDTTANCTGVVLWTLRNVGLLDADFDVNLSDYAPAQKSLLLLRTAHRYCDALPPDEPLKPGDLLFSRWADVDSRASTHHVNILTDIRRASYADGLKLECLAREHGGSGVVEELPMTALDYARIETVYRLRALKD